MVVIACSRLPDSRENEHNCVGKASGGYKPPHIFRTHFFSPTIWEHGTGYGCQKEKKLELIARVIHASGTQQA